MASWGRKYLFNGRYFTIRELSVKYGISERTIRRRLTQGMPLEDAATVSAHQMDRYKNKRSLCWYCANSTNGSKCPWVRSFTPVDGWVADKNHVNGNGKYDKGYDSYNVKSCPLYRADGEG